MSRRFGRLPRRAASALLWYGLPALALAVVFSYIAAAIVLHVNPPVVPVEGVSMRPTLQAGDVVFLEGVAPSRIHKGDVIAVNVPKEARQKYSLPGRVVHRVVKIEHTSIGLVFQTKGDANPGPDVFKVPADEVVGRMTGHVAGLGYPVLFFRSTQGKILLGAIALVVLLYFLMGLFEERQVTVEGTALGLQAVLAETRELRAALGHQVQRPARAPPGPSVHPPPDPPVDASGPGQASPILEPPTPIPGSVPPIPSSEATPPTPESAASTTEIMPWIGLMASEPALPEPELVVAAQPLPTPDRLIAVGRAEDENAQTLSRLLAVVGEYGEHLRSHTAVMQGLAQTTVELQRATEELRRAVAAPSTAAASSEGPEPPPATPEPPAGAFTLPVTEWRPPAVALAPQTPSPEPPAAAPEAPAEPQPAVAPAPPATQPISRQQPDVVIAPEAAQPQAPPREPPPVEARELRALLLGVGAAAGAAYLRHRLKRTR